MRKQSRKLSQKVMHFESPDLQERVLVCTGCVSCKNDMFAKGSEKGTKKGAKMELKMEPKALLGRSWGRLW